MKWFDPTDETKPVILPRAQAEAFLKKESNASDLSLSGRLLMLETGGLISYLEGKYPGQLRQSPLPLPAFLRNYPIYNLGEHNSVSLIEGAYGSPVAVDALETAIAFGCRQAFFFGICGGISREMEIGDVVIPTEVVREEGTSYHYQEHGHNACPDKSLLDQVIRFFSQQDKMRFFSGKTVTTDGLYRQTLRKEIEWQRNGILGVDMEMSALLSAARFHGIPAVALLIVSDIHRLKEDVEWEWGGERIRPRKETGLELFLDFIDRLPDKHEYRKPRRLAAEKEF